MPEDDPKTLEHEDGTDEVRGAIKDAFPQIQPKEVDGFIILMRLVNETHSGA